MKIALGQINPTVGDLSGNIARMVDFSRRAGVAGADLIVFPELSLTGYPPRDLVEKPSFLSGSEGALRQLAHETKDFPLGIVTGYVGQSQSATGKHAANRAALIEGGEILFRQTKSLLPTYDVFDEARYFVPGDKRELFVFRGRKTALAICEDSWNDKQFWDRLLYPVDPIEQMAQMGADLLVSINASPYSMGKRELRRDMFATAARHYGFPLVMVNQIGGNDQLVFDGSSFAMNAQGDAIATARSFAEDLVYVDFGAGKGDMHADLPDECEAVFEALVTGVRDYLAKCGFKKVLIGLSGGIDSSLTAAVAVEAAGRENVMGIGMPGPYSSDHSIADARALAASLGIRFELIPITPTYNQFCESLEPVFEGYQPDVTEENLQARLRGATLMALSNKFGAMVLTTGNKSELAVGYCTLYGDMCGGLAVISDVPKTLVYALSRVANRRFPNAIPESVFTKPPSAELRPDQKDSDSLPPYDVLDAILRAYVEELMAPREIAENLNLPLELVAGIARKVDLNEYKRQQAAPGLKVTTKAFGIGRRFPIAQRYREP
jgi:NAD+ synthase/NAD+ synthase (glutamine-hydrolysing)